MEENVNSRQNTEQEEVFSFKEFLSQCLSRWKWFLLSVVIFCGIGVIYALRQEPVYSRTMAVLIKDQNGGSSADLSSAFSSMGLVASNTNVNNELISLTSPAVMLEVVNRLGLTVNYARKGFFHDYTLYGTNLPFIVKFLDIDEQQGAGFEVTPSANGTYTFDKFYKYEDDEKKEFEKKITLRPGFEPVKTPLGRILISPNGQYVPENKVSDKPILVSHNGLQDCVETYSEMLKGDLADREAEVIDLSISDVSIQRAVDILNAVVAVYNENWVEDKNKIAVATSNFIDDRLAIIEKELGVVDSDISAYKSENMIPDLVEAAKLNMQQSASVSNDMLQVTNELAMATFVYDYINNLSNKNSVIPVNTGIASSQLEGQITVYNNLLLNRNNVVANSSENNPIVEDYDAQLRGLRESISKAVDAQVVSLNTTLKNMQGVKGSVQNQLSSGPTQAKYLLSIERQQKVKESLYLYLLQKREENELTQTFTAYNTRIITPPYGSLRPVAPRKKMIVLIAFLIGLCVPAGALYLADAANNKVRSRKDLEKMATPLAGEIPFVGKRNNFSFLSRIFKKKNSDRDDEKVVLAVKEGSRDVISESFRIVRGSIEFMISDGEASNVIMVTSFNPGSGKSFITYNLAASFAIKGKKVLVIDGDLRHGSQSQFVGMPHKGLSNYLSGATDDWESLLVAVKDQKDMAIMPIGHRPPNPAELLDNGRFGDFIAEVRKEFDYVFVDCPPVDVVVDTQIMEKYVDRTLFVVRAGLLDRSAVAEIDALYRNKRFKQMSLILNGTDGSQGRYHNRGAYGYYGS